MEGANTEENITLILFWLILIGTNAIHKTKEILYLIYHKINLL